MQTVFQKLGPYELLGELGAGGMGVVYLARDSRFGRLVALKVIRPGLDDPEACQRRLRVEAEAAGTLDHPRIVPILDVGEFGATPYLAMKYLPGGTLAEYWMSETSLLAGAPLLMAEVAEAVDHAHQRGVLHRDLKPSNILLDEEGRPHLTDFGLAKLLGSDLRLTLAQSPLGTCGYMAPEVARNGAQDATIASDIYSLGAVLYEWIAGRPPYVARSYPEFLEQIRAGDPPPPRRVRQSNRPGPRSPQEAARERDLELICLRCLERDPQRRYASARSLAQDLEALAAGRPLSVRPQRPDERLAAWLRQNRVFALSAAAVLVSLLLGLGLTTWQWISAEQARRGLQETNVRLALERFELESTRAQRREALRDLVRLHQENPDNELIQMRLWSALVTRHHLMRQLPPLHQAGPIAKMSFTLDGRWLLVSAGGNSPAVSLWDSQSGELLGSIPIRSPEGWQMDHTGQRLLTISPDGRAECRSIPSCERFPGPWDSLAMVEAAALSPSGQTVATLSGNELKVRDRRGGVLSWTVRLPGRAHLLTFSQNGQEILAAGVDGLAWRYSAELGNCLESLEPALGPIRSVEASPRGEGYLLVGDRVASIGPPGPKLPERLRQGFSASLVSVGFSPDGSKVVLATSDRIQILQVPGGRPDRSSPGSGYMRLTNVRLSPDGTTLALALESGDVWLNNASERLVLPGIPQQLAFSPDARRLAVGTSDGAIHLLAVRNRLMSLVSQSWSNVAAWAGSPGGDGLVVVATNGIVRWQDPIDGLTTMPMGQLPWLPDDLEYDTSGRWLVARTDRGALAIRDGRSTLGKWTILGTSELAQPVHWSGSKSGDRLLLSFNGTLELWDVSGTGPQKILNWEVPKGTKGYLSSRGTQIAEVSTEDVWIRDVDGREPLRLDGTPPGPFREVAFSPDGRWLAVLGRQGILPVWNLGRGSRPAFQVDHGSELNHAFFHPHGGELLTCGLDRQLKRWNLPDGSLKGRSLRFANLVEALAFSPDGRRMATAAGRDLEVWDAATLSPIEERRHYPGVPVPRFSTDGRRLIISVGATTRDRVEVLDLPSQQVPAAGVMRAWAQLAMDAPLEDRRDGERLSAGDLAAIRAEIEPGFEPWKPLRGWRIVLTKPSNGSR